MKTILITSFFLLCGCSLFAQQPQPDAPMFYKQNHLISWGSFVYSDDLRGLGSLMTDLQKVDEKMYNNLLPDYQLMQERQRQSRLIGGIGGGLGLVLFMHGILSGWIGNDSNQKFKPNYYTLVGGGVILSGSLVFANTKLVKRHDILFFVNRFNQLAKGDKLRFSLMPRVNYSEHFYGGLSFGLKF